MLDAYRDSGVDLELIVVDNGSPFLQDMLAEAGDLNIRLDRNMGYSGGVNTGLIHATAPVIGVGSIDILMPPKWGNKFLEAAPLVASPLETGRELRYAETRGDYWPAMFTFPADALENVGLFDTVVFSAWADRDFGIRLAQAGYGFTRVDVPVDHLASNHAHKHSSRSGDSLYQQSFTREVDSLRRIYGVQEWREWMRAHRPDDA